MQFKITLKSTQPKSTLPINYQYPMSSALYRIIAKGDTEYAAFLHQSGYGKGFKLFTFSQVNCPFLIEGDRLHMQDDELWFIVSFHLPQAMENFIRGLFQSERIDIADKHSRASFTVKSIESLPDSLSRSTNNEIVNIELKPLSPVVVGLHNEKGNYDFLSPDDARFAESLLYNWRGKIAACYDEPTAASALLLLEVVPMKHPFKSRLITIKADTPEMTQIRGWINFGLKVTGEKRFVELLVNAGAGLYNAMGCGCVQRE
jgi:CRISPR-associated endoribonuclease Cas6